MLDIQPWLIRFALPSETEYLTELALRSKAYWGYSEEFINACRQGFTVDLNYIEQNPTFVLENKELIIGFYSLEHLSENEVELGFLFIEPSEIGKGYGRKLIMHAKQQGQNLGYRRIIIQSDPNAEQFYLNVGGTRIGTKKYANIPNREFPLLQIDLHEIHL
ncbi:GNAT family N-acetyltransferase [Mastigocoleus testarum]|uniref:GNAT family N-acetyltransferase n=1 Tax=Mastigocoleus testarum TaxID=996925 RepID=UPI000403E6EA|nr:GNAT family N-acetyltransferase [Mastigocoleus testarum]